MRRYHHISQAERRKRKAPVRPPTSRSAIVVLLAAVGVIFAIIIAPSILNYQNNPVDTQPQSLSQTPEDAAGVPSNLKLMDPTEQDDKNTVSNNGVSINLRFELCGSERIDCVLDGDTLWVQGVKIRVADIDTPEISQPKCEAEKALGDRATMRFLGLVNEGPFELQTIGNRDEDRFGRKLRVLVRDGQSLGNQLVEEGLARTWTGRREPWC